MNTITLYVNHHVGPTVRQQSCWWFLSCDCCFQESIQFLVSQLLEVTQDFFLIIIVYQNRTTSLTWVLCSTLVVAVLKANVLTFTQGLYDFERILWINTYTPTLRFFLYLICTNDLHLICTYDLYHVTCLSTNE